MSLQATAQALGDHSHRLEREISALTERADSVRDGLVTTDRALAELARAHPLVTLAGATLAGFLVGRLVSRL